MVKKIADYYVYIGNIPGNKSANYYVCMEKKDLVKKELITICIGKRRHLVIKALITMYRGNNVSLLCKKRADYYVYREKKSW